MMKKKPLPKLLNFMTLWAGVLLRGGLVISVKLKDLHFQCEYDIFRFHLF